MGEVFGEVFGVVVFSIPDLTVFTRACFAWYPAQQSPFQAPGPVPDESALDRQSSRGRGWVKYMPQIGRASCRERV